MRNERRDERREDRQESDDAEKTVIHRKTSHGMAKINAQKFPVGKRLRIDDHVDAKRREEKPREPKQHRGNHGHFSHAGRERAYSLLGNFGGLLAALLCHTAELIEFLFGELLRIHRGEADDPAVAVSGHIDSHIYRWCHRRPPDAFQTEGLLLAIKGKQAGTSVGNFDGRASGFRCNLTIHHTPPAKRKFWFEIWPNFCGDAARYFFFSRPIMAPGGGASEPSLCLVNVVVSPWQVIATLSPSVV